MSKRFTATEKWEKPWFQDLPPHLKCLWQYMCDKCDCVGVWEMNWKAASMFIGKTVAVNDLEHFKGKVATFGAKLVIGGFIEFQYGKLSEDCRAHIPVFRTLAKHSLSIAYSKALNSLKEKEGETEVEQEPETEGGMQGGTGKQEKQKPEQPGYSVPACFAQVDGFTAALGMWIENRKALKKPATSAAIQLMLHKLAERPAEAIHAIQTCVRNGWQGFEWGWLDKDKTGGPGNNRNTPTKEEDDKYRAKYGF